MPPDIGALLRAALEASCFRGAFPPVDFRAVCLVLAILSDVSREFARVFSNAGSGATKQRQKETTEESVRHVSKKQEYQKNLSLSFPQRRNTELRDDTGRQGIKCDGKKLRGVYVDSRAPELRRLFTHARLEKTKYRRMTWSQWILPVTVKRVSWTSNLKTEKHVCGKSRSALLRSQNTV